MSLSKGGGGAPTAAEEEDEPGPRRPTCTRCRHHGIVVLLKGHRKWCPFLNCDCWKCYLITQRTEITILQRSLKRGQSRPQDKQQPRPGAPAPDRAGNPAAKGSPSAAAPDQGARPSLTSGLASPRPEGAAGRADGSTRAPREPRDRAAAGGEREMGLRHKELLPFTSGEEGPCLALNARYLGNGGSAAPQPVICYTGHFPSSFGLWPKVVYNVQQLPPPPPPRPPPGFYNSSCPVFTPVQQGASNFPPLPPEPGPPADCRRVFFTLQPPPLTDAPQEEVMSRPPPPSSYINIE